MARVEDLEAIARRSKKPLPWYGLAMEYRSAGRVEEALATFRRVHELDAGYVPAYFMCAQLLAEQGRAADAGAELDAGMAAARAAGDAHALAEMEELRASL